MTKPQTPIDDLLKSDGPIAVIFKQYLRPAEGEGEPIFPPTYPMPTYRGRVHTVRDGEYRVSVELPPFRQDGAKGDKNESQDVAGYNIDEFKDGTNVCEIDSPQSQANRIEPLFETIKGGKLVPQVRIKVGKDQVVNLLSAGHRAADAVVRLSSLVDQFHAAFNEVRKGNHLKLGQLAPTSILFGVWDSRGTQVKLPRIIKAEIRATNVEKLTKSAQFNPAINFVDVEAVDESLDSGEGDKNPLGAEGMKHVPAPRAAGGVKVHGEIKRVVRINLVAIRELRAFKENAFDQIETDKLQKYLLGLALVAATQPLPLNLREGCLLCGIKDETKKTSIKVVKADGDEPDFQMDSTTAETFAEAAARSFFGDSYDQKDFLNATFESGVANKFLAMKPEDRKKIARSGPITEAAIRKFEEKGKDPLKLVSEAIKEAKKAGTDAIKTVKKTAKEAIAEAEKTAKAAKKADPNLRGKNASPIIPDAFVPLTDRLDELMPDIHVVAKLKELIANDSESLTTFKSLKETIDTSPVVMPDVFNPVSERLTELATDDDLDQPVKQIAGRLQELIANDSDTVATCKSLEEAIDTFNKQRQEGGAATESTDTSDTEQA